MISMRSFIDEMEKIADDGLLGEFTRTGVVSPTASTRPSHNDRTAAGRRVVRTPHPLPAVQQARALLRTTPPTDRHPTHQRRRLRGLLIGTG